MVLEAAHTPLCLHAEEYPDPSSENFEQLHQENPTLQIVEVVQMRAKLETPCTAEHQIHDYHTVVNLLCIKIEVAT